MSMNNKKIYEEQRNIENIKKNIETPEKIRKEINYKFSLIIFIPLALVFLIAIGVIIFFVFRETQQLEILETKMRPPDPEVYSAASPFPFQELTIPYLRAKDYESSLSDLEQISSNSEYTSYLTSYVSDGFRINGLLTKPSGEAPEGGFPAIIFVHGYIPLANYVTTSNYSSYVDYLAQNGFAVFKIDLRGHGNSEGESGGAYYSGDYVVDTLSAVDAIKDLDFVNPERIGLWGHSMAGNVTFRSFVAEEKILALVFWAGAVYSYED